ncbi:MAG: hypothetical protein IAG10_15325 [Planctomycetaceae bacterium]|nr:hypothetical protein [Planctomycetaceae bacterium]
MKSLEPEIARSAAVIGDFIYRHGIEYSRFVRLRSYGPAFKHLNERRLRDWAPIGDESLPKRTPHRSTQACLTELAAWITSNEETLLRALGVKSRVRPKDVATRGNEAPQLSQGNGCLNSGDIGTLAVRLAGQGYASAALQLLDAAFTRYHSHDIDAAMSLLPTSLYLLHRYSSPPEMAETVKSISKRLKRKKKKSFGDPIHRNLALGQIACALNERGHGAAAGRLFFCPETRGLWDTSERDVWPKSQLLRNVAMHWLLHGHRSSEAIAFVQQADSYDPENLGNRRAGATVRCLAHFSKGRSSLAKAWEAIEPYYEHSRQILVSAAESHEMEIPDVLHVYSGLYFGVLARSLSGSYRLSRSDLDADLHALQWCQQEFGPIHIDSVSNDGEIGLFPSPIEEIRQSSLRPLLSADQADAFIDLQETLFGK